jgi:hypothetical protein
MYQEIGTFQNPTFNFRILFGIYFKHISEMKKMINFSKNTDFRLLAYGMVLTFFNLYIFHMVYKNIKSSVSVLDPDLAHQFPILVDPDSHTLYIPYLQP